MLELQALARERMGQGWLSVPCCRAVLPSRSSIAQSGEVTTFAEIDDLERLKRLQRVSDAALATKGSRRAYWGESWIDTPVYDGAQLGTGARVQGPALIEEPFTVVVVPPGATVALDAHGNYVVGV